MYRSLDSAGLVQGYEIKIVQIVFHAFGLQIAWAWLSYYMYKHLKKNVWFNSGILFYLYNLIMFTAFLKITKFPFSIVPLKERWLI